MARNNYSPNFGFLIRITESDITMMLYMILIFVVLIIFGYSTFILINDEPLRLIFFLVSPLVSGISLYYLVSKFINTFFTVRRKKLIEELQILIIIFIGFLAYHSFYKTKSEYWLKTILYNINEKEYSTAKDYLKTFCDHIDLNSYYDLSNSGDLYLALGKIEAKGMNTEENFETNEMNAKTDFEKALFYYRYAIKIHNNDTELLENLAFALSYLGYYDESLSYHLKSISLGTIDYRSYLNAALLYLEVKGDLENAIPLFYKSLMFNFKNSDTYCGIGEYYLYKKNYEFAIINFDKSIDLNKDDPEPYAFKAFTLNIIGKYSLSSKMKNISKEKRNDYDEFIFNRANLVIKNGNKENAVLLMKVANFLGNENANKWLKLNTHK